MSITSRTSPPGLTSAHSGARGLAIQMLPFALVFRSRPVRVQAAAAAAPPVGAKIKGGQDAGQRFPDDQRVSIRGDDRTVGKGAFRLAATLTPCRSATHRRIRCDVVGEYLLAATGHHFVFEIEP